MRSKKEYSRNLLIIVAIISIIAGMLLATISFYTGFKKGKDFLAFALESSIKNEPVIQKAIEIQKAFELVAKAVMPTVVNISTETVIKQRFNFEEDPFFKFFGKEWFDFFFGTPQQREFVQRSLGTGVIVAKDGYILTNYHVIKDATRIKIKLKNGKIYKAKVIGADPKSDIAIVKIETKDDLPVAPLGDSDKINIGDWAIAIGNPFGLSHTYTVGVISAKGRSGIMADSSKYENFIQTDASINPGNSGGPLLNIKGEVIGINTIIASPSGGNVGIGFAIPINMAKKIMEQLKTKGRVDRGWLGISIQDLNAQIAKHFNRDPYSGVLVADVMEDSPADEAGFKTGDIIIEYKGKKITDSNQLRNLVAETEPGTRVKIKILRKGKIKTLKVKIGKLPETEEEIASTMNENKTSLWLGLKVKELTPSLARQFKLDTDEKGVIVVRVEPGSAALISGIRPGDIIKQINGITIKKLSDYKKFIKRHKKEDSFLFLIKRGNALFYLTVEKEE